MFLFGVVRCYNSFLLVFLCFWMLIVVVSRIFGLVAVASYCILVAACAFLIFILGGSVVLIRCCGCILGAFHASAPLKLFKLGIWLFRCSVGFPYDYRWVKTPTRYPGEEAKSL